MRVTQAMELFLGLHHLEGGDLAALATPYPDTTTALLAALHPVEEEPDPPAAASLSPTAAPPAHGSVRTQQDELAPQQEDEERTTALLASLPLRTHDGVIGVQADLLDLEPLEPMQQQAAAGVPDPLGAADHVRTQLSDLLL